MYIRHHFRFDRFERRASRMFDKGDLKYVVLDLLKDRPRHGYDIIKAIENRFMGFYSPSAGSIYPTLQLLQDMGLVTAAEQDGKKTYTITDEGRKFLLERDSTVGRIKDGMRARQNMEEMAQASGAIADLAFTVQRLQWRSAEIAPEKLLKIKEILAVVAKATAELRALNI